MPDTIYSVDGKSYSRAKQALGSGDEWVINPAESATNAVEVHNIAHGADCDVDLVESTEPGEYSPGARVRLGSFEGEGISQGNQIEANDNGNLFIVITNTSLGPADYIVTGQLVSP